MTAADSRIALYGTPTARGLKTALGVAGFVALTILGAKISVVLPGTPVPLTLQTAVVLLSGVALGARLGSASQLLYLLLGLVGLPVFAQAGAGPSYVFGASFGYLVGFLVAPLVVGRLTADCTHHCRHGSGTRGPNWRRVLVAVLVGDAIILGLGVLWLAVRTGSMPLAMQYGLFPFLLGEILKCGLAATLGRLWGPSLRDANLPQVPSAARAKARGSCVE